LLFHMTILEVITCSKAIWIPRPEQPLE